LEDRAGLEELDRFAARPILIDDRWNLVVRIDLEKGGSKLLATLRA